MDEPRLRNLSVHGKILSRQTLEDLWTGPHRTLYIFLVAGILLYCALVLNKKNETQIVTVPDSAQAEEEIRIVYINTDELLCGWTAPACLDDVDNQSNFQLPPPIRYPRWETLRDQ